MYICVSYVCLVISYFSTSEMSQLTYIKAYLGGKPLSGGFTDPKEVESSLVPRRSEKLWGGRIRSRGGEKKPARLAGREKCRGVGIGRGSGGRRREKDWRGKKGERDRDRETERQRVQNVWTM